MFGSCSRLACSELATQLRRTRELDLPSWPEQRIVVPTTHNTGKKPRCRREHIRTMFLKEDFTNLHTWPSLRDILQANHINILWTYTVPSDQLTVGASGKSLPHQDIDTSCINLWELQWTFSLKTAQPHRQHATELFVFSRKVQLLCFENSWYVVLNLQLFEHDAHTISSDHWFILGSAACEWHVPSHPSWPKGRFNPGWMDRFNLVKCSTESLESEEGTHS